MTRERMGLATLVRALVWAGGLGIVGFGVATRYGSGPVIERVFAANVVTYLLPMALVVAAGLLVSVRTAGRGAEHRFWLLSTISVTFVLIGEIRWTWYTYTVDLHGPPMDSPHMLLFVVAAMLYLAIGVQVTLRSEEPMVKRLTMYLDTLIVMVVLYAVAFLIWVWPAFSGVEPRLTAAVGGAARLVFGALLFVATGAVLVAWRRYRWRQWERLAAYALLVYGAGLSLFPVWYPEFLDSAATTLPWFPSLLAAGVYLLFAAMVYRLTDRETDEVDARWPTLRLEGRLVTTVYPVLAVAAMILLGGRAISLSGSPHGLPVIICAVALSVLLGARSWVMEVERGRHQLSAVTDHATGVFSRRHLDLRLQAAQAESGDAGFTLTVFDVDGFGRFEDRDEALSVLFEVAAVLDDVRGQGDELFRLGADQFALIQRDSDTARAEALAQAAIVFVRDRILDRLGTLVGMTAGIAVYPDHGDGVGLIEAARNACRAAKGAVGGQVVVVGSTPSVPTGTVLHELVDSRARAARDTVIVLAAAVDARDAVTRHHSAGVAELMERLCRALGMSEDRVRVAGLAALVHDVGKIGVPDSILGKPGPLSEEERALIREHCDLGERILAAARLTEILPIARHHHERWDGRGYPDGLAGHDIPFEARALAVCDTFETLVAGRPYQAARSVEEAIAEIEANAGTQFDPMVSAVFVRMVRRENGVRSDVDAADRPDAAAAGA